MPEDKRAKEWKKQRAKYGVDERFIWSLNETMDMFLFMNLKMFMDCECNKDEDDIVATIDGEPYTLYRCVDEMLQGLKIRMTIDDLMFTPKQEALAKNVYKIYAACHPCLWT
jgi:hypothetical protein